MPKKWFFLLAGWLLISLLVEPRTIPRDCGQIQDEAADQEFQANEAEPGTEYSVFVLPDGDSIRVIYRVDEYGFYPETLTLA